LNTPEKSRGRCPDARALLPAYVENELSAIELRLVQGHLDICSACRNEEASYRLALSALSAAPRPAHGDLYAGLSARLDNLERPASFRPRQLRWVATAACLLLVVGVGATIAAKTLFVGKPAGTESAPPAVTFAQGDPNSGQQKPAPLSNGDKSEVVKIDEPVTLDNSDIGSKNDLPDTKYYPEEPRPAPEPKQTPRAHKQRVEDIANTDFTKVKDSRGRTVEDIMAELKKHNRLAMDKTAGSATDTTHSGTDPAPATGGPQEGPIKALPVDDPSMPDVAMIVPEKEKKEAVGEKIVKSSRAEGYTKSGRLALIHLTAEAAPKPAPKRDLRKDSPEDTP
jgi:hypothetical protein